MAISGKGEPEVAQVVNLSEEMPSLAVHNDPIERDNPSERIELEASVGEFNCRAAFWVRGSLRPTAELITLLLGVSGMTALVWAICHVERINKWVTFGACMIIGVTTFLAGSVFLRRK
jgi:hypothetical protein